jgi:flagellar protein FlaJ
MGRFEVFEAVADSEDVYGEVSVEFQRIVNQVKYTDIDFQAAVEDVANSCANEELAEFLTSLLSTINAGGSLKEELQEQQQIARRQRKQQLETVVDYLQMAGQAYMALMIAPILLVMLLTITALTGDAQIGVLLGVVYGVGPLINILFFLMVSSIKQDEVGRGYIRLDDGTIPNKSISNPFNFGAIEDYYSKHKSFRRTYRKEVQRTLWGYVTSPLSFFIDHPQFLFIVTAPATILGIAGLIAMDIITLSIDGFIQQPMQQTIGWMVWPAFANLLPFSLAYEWRARKRSAVTDSLSSDLRALANTNSHGKPLPDCLKITAEDQSGKLADEFGNIYKKLQMGIPLGTGIAEFNNKYQIPRLARMMKIVDQSREVSTNISDVLSTAADTAEFQAEIVEKRNAKMKVQVIIVEGAFLIFLGLLVSMDTAFIDFATDIIGDAEALRQGGESADPRLLSVLLIHTALIQGFSSGFLAGYFKTSEIGRGAKYALFNIALVLLAWAVAPTLLQYVSL